MNKKLAVGIIIGVIVVISIIGMSSSLISENSQDETSMVEEIPETTKPTGRSLTLELTESIGIKAIPWSNLESIWIPFFHHIK